MAEALIWSLILLNLAVALLAEFVTLLAERFGLLDLLLSTVLAHAAGRKKHARRGSRGVVLRNLFSHVARRLFRRLLRAHRRPIIQQSAAPARGRRK